MNSDKIKSLADVLLKIHTMSEMNEFLKGLFTEGELEEIAKRIQIIKKLKNGIPQHRIAKELGVGVATVTRGSKEIQKGRFAQVK